MGHKLKITDTTLRDAHQSLWATRMHTDDMLPICKKLDSIGYHSIECWGGAVFDVCMRFLDEDPWERLRKLKQAIPNTPLQMLLRGQSLVGYQHYPDDVVTAFIKKAVENGIDIIRIFDALNDIRNLEVPIQAAKEAGAHVQAAVVYTISPVHTTEHYLDTAISLANMGADSICIKDMAGLLTPYVGYELIKLFKQKLSIPVQLHSHYIGGLAVGCYLKGAEAGVDVIDTASVPLAFGASQPPVETVVRALHGSPYDTGLDIHALFEISKYWEELRKRKGFERGVTRITDMRVFDHQVPGGMISNLVSQLEEQKALHRITEVLEEIPRVREDLGFPPLVTPTSQIVGTQAVLNVLAGERYKLVPGEVKAYIQGHYGKPPAPINKKVQKLIIGDKKVIDCRPADILEPRMDRLKEEIGDLAQSEEDVLSYALFPQVARKYLENRANPSLKEENNNKGSQPVTADQTPKEAKAFKEAKEVNLKEIKELIKMLDETDIRELHLESEGVKIAIKKGNSPVHEETIQHTKSANTPKAVEVIPEPEKTIASNLISVVAPMVGTFYRTPSPEAPPFVDEGTVISKGQPVCIIEAMKLMNEIEADAAGKIVQVLVENGQPVEYGQPLFLIEPIV